MPSCDDNTRISTPLMQYIKEMQYLSAPDQQLGNPLPGRYPKHTVCNIIILKNASFSSSIGASDQLSALASAHLRKLTHHSRGTPSG